MKLRNIATIALLALVSCGDKPQDPEVPAQALLNEARTLMDQKNYAAAKDSILSLRQQYPMALNARKAAILTLDSVELFAARDSAQAYEITLQSEKDAFAEMKPRENGKTNEAYYAQQRLLFDMNNHYDELCAKVQFFIRKIQEDQKK